MTMEKTIYTSLMTLMPWMALVVFLTLFFVKAGYGMFLNKRWGLSLPNKIGWMVMEFPAFLSMLLLWLRSDYDFYSVPFIFFLLFEVHYFQRTFIFPLLMRGSSKMPISLMLMGIVFNVINGFLLGEGLFLLVPNDKYTINWLSTPQFTVGLFLFIVGMVINLHSDSVIRNLRTKGDTKHYLPQRGMYKYVTSANYLGELTEWIGFAILTQCDAAWVFTLWTFANLAPRSYTIRKHYMEIFGRDAVGKRKCLIPFIF